MEPPQAGAQFGTGQPLHLDGDDAGAERPRHRAGATVAAGVDTELFHPQAADPEMRARLTAGQPERPLLLYVGRLSAEKEVGRIRVLLEQIPQARLAIVGDGPERGSLEQHFAGYDVVFTGYLQGQDLAAAFASADLFVFPSRTETLGLVLLEAMAAGCPVIAPAAAALPMWWTAAATAFCSIRTPTATLSRPRGSS